jgi:hypothetical protein
MTWQEVPITKAPGDEKTYSFRYDWLLNNPTYAGYALSSFSFTMLDSAKTDVSSAMIVTSGNDSKFISVTLVGGADNEDYTLRCLITFTKAGSPDYVKGWIILVQVREEGA